MNKNIILTGGHSGIGLELTKKLLSEDHHLGLILRNKEKQNELSKIINTKKIDFFYADLSKQKEVRRVAEEISQKWESVDILFNNAGVLLEKLYFSEQNNEMHFEVNTLAPFILSKILTKNLNQNKKLTIINTVTDFLHKQKSLNLKSLIKPTKFRKLLGAYLQSKYALTLLMNDWASKDNNVQIINVTPGPNKTKMTAGKGMPTWLIPIRGLLFSNPNKGATFLYDAAFRKDLKEKSGIYIQNNKVLYLTEKLNENDKTKILEIINL